MTSDFYFRWLTACAQELVVAEKRGGPLDPKFTFPAKEACATCMEPILPPKKVLRCSACKSILYCSSECSKRGWKVPPGPHQSTHKMCCENNKRQMEKLHQIQAITKLFPWGRLECDGSFNFDIARGRFRVLGGSGYGYWSHRGGLMPHSADLGNESSTSPYAKMYGKIVGASDHIDGKDLLEKEHLSDEEGWKLPSEFIPYRNFSTTATRPKLVTEFEHGVVDWDSWYRWRNLSKESPAALLMHFPMSVYQMVVNCLELTSPSAGQADNRVVLDLHLLGVEVELNFLPLFSELALLLPYHDIKLVLFGSPVASIVKEAKKTPGSLATKSPTFTYTAPPECGSGSVSIHLHSKSDFWSATNDVRPDALIACNAGLMTYSDWHPVIQAAYLRRIPFATTDYTEEIVANQIDMTPVVLSWARIPAPPIEKLKFQMNPFQRPGQRNLPMSRLPNAINGFTAVVYKD